ncbi:hypothetical protein G3545_08125 [Starkeya sp. ORNL1]|uniref:hypothetical protein n=1 Tax=Starkeya sp. ORNL1 TaxID=2709380 RepID=UPI00146308AB|nr:hypothetical protein [Starkeya sp. ORNL1]QJP13628.1 hypothetical protein G3545_08125 [Starkeya sp. ORNL1]
MFEIGVCGWAARLAPAGYYDNGQRSPEPMELVTIQRIRTTQAVVDAVTARMHPGTVMATVDVPLSADTRKGKDFVIITNEVGS